MAQIHILSAGLIARKIKDHDAIIGYYIGASRKKVNIWEGKYKFRGEMWNVNVENVTRIQHYNIKTVRFTIKCDPTSVLPWAAPVNNYNPIYEDLIKNDIECRVVTVQWNTDDKFPFSIDVENRDPRTASSWFRL